MKRPVGDPSRARPINTPRRVYLVVTENGLFSAGTDWTVAERQARNIGAVIAECPIVADFRPGGET